MILDEIILQLKKDKEKNSKLKNFYAFHVFGLITIFIKEKSTHWPIELRCIRGGLRTPNIIFEGYSIKPPYEFMLELFYFNKIDYLVKDIKRDAMKNLFKQYGFKEKDSSVSKNHDTLVTYIKNKDPKILASKIEEKALDCQKMYAEILQNPNKFFKIDSTVSSDKSYAKDVKKHIKEKYLKQKSIIDAPSENKNSKKSSADAIPKMISKIKKKLKNNH